jgi:hypothetical protein
MRAVFEELAPLKSITRLVEIVSDVPVVYEAQSTALE